MNIHVDDSKIRWRLMTGEVLIAYESPFQTLQAAFNDKPGDIPYNKQADQLLLADLTYLSQLRYGFRRGWQHSKNHVVIYGRYTEQKPDQFSYVATAVEDAAELLLRLSRGQTIYFDRIEGDLHEWLEDPFSKWMIEVSPMEQLFDQEGAIQDYLKRRYLFDEDTFGMDINLHTPVIQEWLYQPGLFRVLGTHSYLDYEWGNSEILEKLDTLPDGKYQLQLEIDNDWTTMLKFRVVDLMGNPIKLSDLQDPEVLFNLERPRVEWGNNRILALANAESTLHQTHQFTRACWAKLQFIFENTKGFTEVPSSLKQMAADIKSWQHDMDVLMTGVGSQAALDYDKANPRPADINPFAAVPQDKLMHIYGVMRAIDRQVEDIIRLILSDCYSNLNPTD